jgi:lipopolysaccharide transport system ATP-binding protein
MSDSVIRVENLSKRYTLSHQQEGRSYKSLRDVMADGARSVGKRLLGRGDRLNPNEEDFWALKDVSFEIKQGDRVGIIGRNGAGKSTLLKILSRIVEPTTGEIGIRGRVASLLEVGTGFHPELTGRENIFLNGAILGMARSEITRKFDEIVAFAEVEKFLDTPVKRYSSGMYVRLAFAVAAHLEPEILIVDEVLAVGDAQFQKKCLGKMEDVAGEGRTVIFVSHQMGSITHLCTSGIYLRQGEIVETGHINDVVERYVMAGSSDVSFVEFPKKKTSSPITCNRISVSNNVGIESSELDIRYPFNINIEYEVNQPINNVEISIRVLSNDGRAVFTTSQSDCTPQKVVRREVGHYKASIEVPEMFLMPGSYMLYLGIHEPMVYEYESHDNVICFHILETGTKLSKYGPSTSISGVVLKDLVWKQYMTSHTLEIQPSR